MKIWTSSDCGYRPTGCYIDKNIATKTERSDYTYSGKGCDAKTVEQWKAIFDKSYKIMRKISDCSEHGALMWAIHFASLMVFCGVKASDIFYKNPEHRRMFPRNTLYMYEDYYTDGEYLEILKLKSLDGLRGEQKFDEEQSDGDLKVLVSLELEGGTND